MTNNDNVTGFIQTDRLQGNGKNANRELYPDKGSDDMEGLFETIANAIKPEVHCDIMDRCPEGVDNCEECLKLVSQAEEEDE